MVLILTAYITFVIKEVAEVLVKVSVEFTIDKTVDYEINVYDKGLSNSVVATTHEIVTTELTKDGEKVDYAIGSAITEIGDYTLVLTDSLGNKEVITFRIIQPKV